MSITKQIPAEQWGEFFDTFTNGNKGRLIKLEVIDREMGDETPVENMPLWVPIYDPVGKGNDLTVEIGRDEIAYSHTIEAPNEVWQERDDNGKVVALEIKTEDGTQTILQLL